MFTLNSIKAMTEPLKTRKRIIRQLRDTRKARGLSLRDVEKLSGVDNSNLSEMEKGKRNLSLDTLIKLARALALKVVLVDADEYEDD